jgi:hypothetical protein
LLSHPKDSVPLVQKSVVVYLIPYKDCTHIGETSLHLSTRLQQHKEATRKGETDHSVAKHVWDMQHSIDWENASVIDRDPHTVSRKIKETIDIRKNRYLMNRDEGLETSHMWDSLLFPNV